LRRIRLLAFLLLILAAPPAFALQVRDALWGFSGQVVPQRFNILSVLVENDTAKPFDGALRARRVDFGQAVGPWVVEPCYLVPFASRWVQFQIFTEEPEETWAVSWGEGPKESATLPAPRFGPPAVVLLEPEGGRMGVAPQIKRFPEELFPTSVTATDGLCAVVLDHAPRWEEARRTAFLDWLRLGGVVHVARNSFGETPQFGGDLAALAAEGRVGLGRVVRHPVAARDISEETLARSGFPAATFREPPQGNAWGLISLTDDVMRKLNDVSKPQHNWWMIFGCAGAYLLLIGPVNWIVGRKMEYRRVFLYFFLVVLSFSVLMSFVGQRGRGRAARIYTLTEARPLGGGQYALSQWTTLFATRGANYAVAHASEATGSEYATPGVRTQPAQGAIRNGRAGGLLVDVPINSSRFMVHRSKAAGKEWAAQASGWDPKDPTGFIADGSLPPNILWAYAVTGNSWIWLQIENGRLRGTATAPELPGITGYAPYARRRQPEGDSDAEVQEALRSAAVTIMADASGATEKFRDAVLDPQRPTRHLFIACEGGGEFNLAPNRLGRERNIVIYHYSYSSAEN